MCVNSVGVNGLHFESHNESAAINENVNTCNTSKSLACMLHDLERTERIACTFEAIQGAQPPVCETGCATVEEFLNCNLQGQVVFFNAQLSLLMKMVPHYFQQKALSPLTTGAVFLVRKGRVEHLFCKHALTLVREWQDPSGATFCVWIDPRCHIPTLASMKNSGYKSTFNITVF